MFKNIWPWALAYLIGFILLNVVGVLIVFLVWFVMTMAAKRNQRS